MSERFGKPLARTLVRNIFAVYLALAVLLTFVQIIFEYRNTYADVLREIDAIAQAFEPGVSNAVWNFQKPFLESIAQGMVSGGVITGVKIHDLSGKINVALGQESDRNNALAISKNIPLFQTYGNEAHTVIGSMIIYSSHEIVIGRVKLGVLLILIASIVKTAGLWFIIVFFANRLLAKPLRQFTEQIKSFDLAQETQKPHIELDPTPSSELAYLRDTFCELAAKAIVSKQLMMQKEVAVAANHAKSQFLAAISHDLRQPMHALHLHLDSLLRTDISPDMQICAGNVRKCAKAMNEMLDTLLDVSRIDAGVMQPRCSAFPVFSILDRMQVEFEPLAREKGLTLRVVPCSAFVDSDEEIAERILRNLVANAIRYTEHGTILIGCRRRGAQLRVAVYDTGIGIAKEKQQAIFEEYYQIDRFDNNFERNRVHVSKGLGLGLAIVQRLTKLLDIPIVLNSELGGGSMFAIDLPRIDLDAIQPVVVALSLTVSNNGLE